MLAVHQIALVLFAPCALFACALLQVLAARILSAREKGILATITCAPAFAAVTALIPSIQSGKAIDLVLGRWDGPLTLALHIDALSILFALMGTGLGAIVLLYSIGYMAHDKAATRFYATMLAFIGGFVTLVFSANLFVLYMAWELIGLCSFSLVGFWYAQHEAVEGARKVLLMTHIAGYGLLAAILILYQRSGTALWTDPAIARSFTAGVFLLMLLALMAKSVQFPLHTWIPDAMAAPTPVSSLLHAACYVTAGVYLAARMHSFCPWPQAWSLFLIAAGTITMPVGVLYAMVQNDLKRMLAFSTVSQIGYMMLGIGIGTPLAITAGLLHCLNHGFFKGGLFLNAGAVQHAAGTRDMNQLGGLAPAMPRTTLCWLVGVANMAGIPLMSGFVSKWMLYAAALQAGWIAPALVAWIVSLGTVFLCAKATSAVFLGPTTECTEKAHEAAPTMQWAMGLMALGGVVLGVAPQLAVNYLLNPILASLQLGEAMHVTWFGLFAGAGSFSTVGGLMLALVSLALGGAVYAVARPIPAIAHASGRLTGPQTAILAATAGGGYLGGAFTGGEPVTRDARLTAYDFSRLIEQNCESFFRWTQVDRVYLGIWKTLRSFADRLAVAVGWIEHRSLPALLVLTTLLLLLAGWLAPGAQLPAQAPQAAIPLPWAWACGIAGGALLLVLLALDRANRLLLAALCCAAAIAGLLVQAPGQRLGLLEFASLLTIPMVWTAARTWSGKHLYAAAILLASAAFIGSEFAVQLNQSQWAAALLLTAVCIKFAAVPLLFWLLRLADEIPAPLLGIIVAVVDMAAFADPYLLAQQSPALLAPRTLWLVLAILTSLTGAILMLAQRSMKRLLVLSTTEDAGFLMLGLISRGALGTSGLLAAVVTHSLAKALLFLCLSAPERDGAFDVEPAGLAQRYPLSGFGFLIGMLAMLGVPPTVGYIGRWRLYSSALLVHPLVLAAFVVSSALALLAYTRALTRFWWGSPHDAEGAQVHPIAVSHRVLCPTVYEPFLLKAVIVALVAVLLLGGLWPAFFLEGGHP